MPNQDRRKASFTEKNVPPGGLCLSSFVVVASGGRILVGRMAKPEVWVKEFFVGEQYAPGYASSGKYLLPASHLVWYESPLGAAERVLRDQLRLPVAREKIRLVDVQSHVRGDVGNQNEPPHWDICFVYGVDLSPGAAKKLGKLEWFYDLGFRPTSRLSPVDFTRGHGDVLEMAGIISSAKKRN